MSEMEKKDKKRRDEQATFDFAEAVKKLADDGRKRLEKKLK